MYRQGFGIDENLAWVYAKIGDLWKGTGALDPAYLHRQRIPGLNQAAIYNSIAEYKDDIIYLAVPTGTNVDPDTVFALHMPKQKIWMYQYPFFVTAMFFDKVENRLVVNGYGTNTSYTGVPII